VNFINIKLRILLFVLIFSTLTLILSIIYIRSGLSFSGKAPLQKIQDDIERYDNWAVFTDTESLLRENFEELGNTGNFMDRRVVPYAEKLLDETGLDVISSYNMGLVLDVKKNSKDYKWLEANSWRFGFVPRSGSGHGYESHESHANCENSSTLANFRFVGVFPAEQMYYSGLSLEEYIGRIGEIEEIVEIVEIASTDEITSLP
jgi:hypothetical protein